MKRVSSPAAKAQPLPQASFGTDAGRRPVLILTSGGVESGLLVRSALERGEVVTPFYVRCGFVWEKAELARLKRLLKVIARSTKSLRSDAVRRGGVLEPLPSGRRPVPGRLRPLVVARTDARPLYRRHWGLDGRGVPGPRTKDDAVYLAGRNVVLLSQAGAYCATHGIGDILIGTLAANPFPDGKASFFEAASKWLSDGLGRRIRVRAPFRRLHKAEIVQRAGSAFTAMTFSCIHPRGVKPCGKCNKCAERKKAEHEAFAGNRA